MLDVLLQKKLKLLQLSHAEHTKASTHKEIRYNASVHKQVTITSTAFLTHRP